MEYNAGVFPTTCENLDRFSELYLGGVSQVDAMGVWFNVGEDYIVNEYCPSAALMPLLSLEPYYHAEPWSQALERRRVLVVHPFAESIRHQYENGRQHLFRDARVLPPFELDTIRAVQSAAGESTVFATWFDALDWMKGQMDARDYDVLIVGAGAYGLPLAAHAKRAGKQAVHIGGATQLLFGIRGRRWDQNVEMSARYNEYWVRPKASEAPSGAHTVENGCYW